MASSRRPTLWRPTSRHSFRRRPARPDRHAPRHARGNTDLLRPLRPSCRRRSSSQRLCRFIAQTAPVTHVPGTHRRTRDEGIAAAMLGRLDEDPLVAVGGHRHLLGRPAQGRALVEGLRRGDAESREQGRIDDASPTRADEALRVEVDEKPPSGTASERPQLRPADEGDVLPTELLVEPVAEDEKAGSRRAFGPVGFPALPAVEEPEGVDARLAQAGVVDARPEGGGAKGVERPRELAGRPAALRQPRSSAIAWRVRGTCRSSTSPRSRQREQTQTITSKASVPSGGPASLLCTNPLSLIHI